MIKPYRAAKLLETVPAFANAPPDVINKVLESLSLAQRADVDQFLDSFPIITVNVTFAGSHSFPCPFSQHIPSLL
eukprot:m.752866 g.752866  ORF g.752866 m.752866 type:complete len:75 (-) comp58989_c0_seq11:102-326(-)